MDPLWENFVNKLENTYFQSNRVPEKNTFQFKLIKPMYILKFYIGRYQTSINLLDYFNVVYALNLSGIRLQKYPVGNNFYSKLIFPGNK